MNKNIFSILYASICQMTYSQYFYFHLVRHRCIERALRHEVSIKLKTMGTLNEMSGKNKILAN